MSKTSRNIPSFVINNMNWLRVSRVRQGLERKFLSAKIGLHISTVSRYEYGELFPSKESYNKLAEILGWQKWE